MSNIDTGVLHDVADFQAEQPASLAELMQRLATGLDTIPPPIIFHFPVLGGGVQVQLNTLAEFEAWRQWCGAPEVDPGPWTPLGSGMSRRVETVAEWRGQPIVLLLVEFRSQPETAAEKRQRLEAELERLDRELVRASNGGPSHG